MKLNISAMIIMNRYLEIEHMTKHRLYVKIAAKIKVIRSPKLWSSIGNSRDTKLGTKLELNRKLGMKLATADTVTDAGAVTALEVVDRDLSSTVAALAQLKC